MPECEGFRFRRKSEESYNSGMRVLADNGKFSSELQYCNHVFHRACVTSYAEHAILSDGRWCVRCPGGAGVSESAAATGSVSSKCNYRLYHADVKELCGQSYLVLTRCVPCRQRGSRGSGNSDVCDTLTRTLQVRSAEDRGLQRARAPGAGRRGG